MTYKLVGIFGLAQELLASQDVMMLQRVNSFAVSDIAFI